MGFNIISIYNNDDGQAFVWIKMNTIYINLKNLEDVIEESKALNFNPIDDEQNGTRTQIGDSI